ncbi:c-type cytochrome [Sphingopyxis flava]|uniref:Cytochrome C oxidase, cbb3-type, subunit III n=1 Tax=Sphingopyxis flava TaxID=1507287 RepID=A0A1T5DX60_9SPHN|nr:cytochrome c [Sphingopyxis flava]SKB76166.1 Cytochrome C oxidase, cbb3-type, subunit III [Sphingopyxis flava]
MRSLFVAGALLALAAATGPVIAQPSGEAERPMEQANAARGRYLYFQTGCYACHGTIGHGAFLAGPKLTPPLMAFEPFSAQLREPVGRMPRYGAETMSDEDVADIYAFLKAIPPQPTPDSIDMLKDPS